MSSMTVKISGKMRLLTIKLPTGRAETDLVKVSGSHLPLLVG